MEYNTTRYRCLSTYNRTYIEHNRQESFSSTSNIVVFSYVWQDKADSWHLAS